ncbi:hypothetical protein LO762_09235 [Actinocorallia sp. API 0066]|uniref:hypothetical protein n=1 Tax=Actinocorallia sp. API 0066 TaxID=2896846 RepID=UPI001E4BC03D|nr:hypothetical protein [Actinocorallia sp. API 0066]MCD0449371.1 hypothetical protein [Actinocorallia sp. API 0066]
MSLAHLRAGSVPVPTSVSGSTEPAVAGRPGCPAWCTHPHPGDEPHYGPCSDVPALTHDGKPVLVFLERNLERGDIVTVARQTPVWELPATGQLAFTLDQAAALRAVLGDLLAAAGHTASGADVPGSAAS